MKTLILRQKRDDYFLKYINYNDICNIYKIDSKNIFFKIYFKFSLSLLSFYYADWKKKIKSYDKVINNYTAEVRYETCTFKIKR